MVNRLNEANFKDINNLIKDYNSIAKELGEGPLKGSLESFSEMPGLPSSNVNAKAASERVLTVQAKLEELNLKVQQKDFAESKDALEVEIQRIARDKEAGIDVSQREKQLEETIKS